MKAFLFAMLLAGAAVPALAAPDGLLHRPNDPDRAAQACKALTAVRTSGPAAASFHRLGDLPPALHQHAVLRTVEGCPVLEVVMHGKVYYAPSIPTVKPAAPAAFEAR